MARSANGHSAASKWRSNRLVNRKHSWLPVQISFNGQPPFRIARPKEYDPASGATIREPTPSR